MNTILVYVPQITNRVNYLFCIVLSELLGCKILLTDNLNDYTGSSSAKFSYSKNAIHSSLHFYSTNLLFENEIHFDWYKNLTIAQCFKTESEYFNTIDIFAATFFLITRYEEYELENQQQYNFQQSILHRSNLLYQPIVNKWMKDFKEILKQHFPLLQLKNSKYNFLPTIDVDRAFAFKARPLYITIAKFLKDGFSFKFKLVKQRWNVLREIHPDPYDVFDFIESIHHRYQLRAIYFFHAGNYAGADKNILLHHPSFTYLLHSISKVNEVALHPSLKSNHQTSFLTNEYNLLQQLLPSQKIISSRQHYIYFNLPTTYLQLIKLGIQHDYTMGYATTSGFRAGTCSAYKWYNLTEETVTDLTIHPFCFMEATYQYYQKNEMENMLGIAKKLTNEIKNVNGEFVSVWHNHALSEMDEWVGWKSIYQKFIQTCQ